MAPGKPGHVKQLETLNENRNIVVELAKHAQSTVEQR